MPSHDLTIEERPTSNLPQTDGGKDAWLLLTGCFVINVLIWGFSFSFGVFQQYYTTHGPFASNPAGIPAIGTTATGLMYLMMPVYFLVLQRWPRLKAWSTWASAHFVSAALLGTSFAQTVAQLIASQGVLFAIGGNLMFAPTITYLDEWFVRRKGLAVGIMWAGDGIGGVIMPLVIQSLLSAYGFLTALRCLACAMLLLMTPLLKFLKPRLPIPDASAARPTDFGFLRTNSFWVLQTFNIIQGAGSFLPSNYLPTYAQYLGTSAQLGSLTLVLVNLASVLGCVAVGALMDRVDVPSVVASISLCASIAILAVWGCSASLAPLYAFSLLYGLTAGAYSSSWTGMIKTVQAKSETADPNIVFGCLAAGRGLGSIVSGPLSEALIEAGGSLQGQRRLGYGSEYGSLIIFTGCTALAGGSSWIARQSGFIRWLTHLTCWRALVFDITYLAD